MQAIWSRPYYDDTHNWASGPVKPYQGPVNHGRPDAGLIVEIMVNQSSAALRRVCYSPQCHLIWKTHLWIHFFSSFSTFICFPEENHTPQQTWWTFIWASLTLNRSITTNSDSNNNRFYHKHWTCVLLLATTLL